MTGKYFSLDDEMGELRRATDDETDEKVRRLSLSYGMIARLAGTIAKISLKRRKIGGIKKYIQNVGNEALEIIGQISDDAEMISEDDIHEAAYRLARKLEDLTAYGFAYRDWTGKFATELPDYDHSMNLVIASLKRLDKIKNNLNSSYSEECD